MADITWVHEAGDNLEWMLGLTTRGHKTYGAQDKPD